MSAAVATRVSEELSPTPTAPERAMRVGGFDSLAEALDYAATLPTGINLYSLRGQLSEVLPYRVLREQARRLAGRMRAAGLRRGERVGLMAATDGDFVRGFFACQYAGLVPAPLPLPQPFGGRAEFVAHIRRMLHTSEASAAFGPAELAAWLVEATEGLSMRVVGTLDALPERGRHSPEPPGAGPGDLAMLQFSSGSTRAPTGVMITQAALIANGTTALKGGFRVTPRERALAWLPLYHDMGLVGFLVNPLLCQASTDLIPTAAFVRRPSLWPELMSRNGATFSYSPTFGYDLAARRVDAELLGRLDLSHWRVAGVGGDMVRAAPLRAFAQTFAPAGFDARAFVASYGLAEATLAVSMTAGRGLQVDRVDSARLAKAGVAAPPTSAETEVRDLVRCGAPLPGIALEVRDEHGMVLPELRVGRIFVRGVSTMEGYHGRPDETARVLSPDGWLDTGDLGYRADGELVITGRAKDLIIVNGRNIWPQDLEWTVEGAVDELRPGDVAVFSVPTGAEEKIVALVEWRSADLAGRAPARERIAELLRARHGVNAEPVLVKARSLPMTSSGKLSRSKARDLYLAGSFAEAEAVASGA